MFIILDNECWWKICQWKTKFKEDEDEGEGSKTSLLEGILNLKRMKNSELFKLVRVGYFHKNFKYGFE